MLSLREPAWSPYVAGVIIGLLQIPAFLLVGTALGASSSYVTVAAGLASVFDASALDNAYFAKYAESAKYYWQLAMVVAIAFGAYMSARASGHLRQGFSPIWQRAVGATSLWQRGAMGFAAGFIMLFGARLAGGCTSGHGLSGSAQLAISSLLVVAAMFAAGIVTARLMQRI